MGLQADMAVFRELLGYKLPKLAKHLEKLQGSTQEPSFEPPIINVFTIQWFLTLFCNCLPMSYVLRIWDLIMIEGSDILLRAALSIWKMMEEWVSVTESRINIFICVVEIFLYLIVLFYVYTPSTHSLKSNSPWGVNGRWLLLQNGITFCRTVEWHSHWC